MESRILCPVASHARRMPEGVALSWGRRSITWEGLNNYVHSTSRYIKEISVRSGQRVIVLKEDSPSTFIVLLALWRIGAVGCLIDPKVMNRPPAVMAALVKPAMVIGLRSMRKAWPKEYRWADMEQVVAYGYNDSFLGSETSLEPHMDAHRPIVLRLVFGAGDPLATEFTYAQLKNEPGDLAGLFHMLSTEETFIIP